MSQPPLTPSASSPAQAPSGSRSIWSVLGNSQKLDGGAMFGNAPRALWSRWIQPDDLNRIPLACRCLLIQEESSRLILCEAGIGAFFSPDLKAFTMIKDLYCRDR